MRAHDSLKTQWLDGLAMLVRMWLRGWWVIVRLLLFATIVKAGWTMFGWGIQAVERLEVLNAWGMGTSLALIGGAMLVIFPFVFYVAASWVGFCPHIDRDDPTWTK